MFVNSYSRMIGEPGEDPDVQLRYRRKTRLIDDYTPIVGGVLRKKRLPRDRGRSISGCRISALRRTFFHKRYQTLTKGQIVASSASLVTKLAEITPQNDVIVNIATDCAISPCLDKLLFNWELCYGFLMHKERCISAVGFIEATGMRVYRAAFER